MADLQRGVVKWFNDAKGFGFIEHTTGRDVFVHYSVIEWEGFKTLKDGEEVEYELSEGDKGLHAAKVLRKIPKPQPVATQEAGQDAQASEPVEHAYSAEPTISSLVEVERSQTADSDTVPPAIFGDSLSSNGHKKVE